MTLVCGFSEPPEDWDIEDQSEYYNAGSVVARLEFKDKSVLLCGDTVGRHIGDPATACIATEKYILDQGPAAAIKSDVLLAPHHGADNGSSSAFIAAVKPEYVIFSAGHRYEHPRGKTANRYTRNGVKLAKMFRTDRGDNEGGAEWWRGAGSKPDGVGDDDVDVLIRSDATLQVAYRNN